jgi:hypothetical protein
MQNNNSFSTVRVTINRTCLLLFVLVSAISSLMAIDEVRADDVHITFDDYAPGTRITDQYKNLGVIFSGEPNLPIIVPGPYLSAYPLLYPQYGHGCSSISISFVDKIDGTPDIAFLSWMIFYFSYYDVSSPITIFYYDINGDIIYQEEVYWGGPDDPWYPYETQKIVAIPSSTNCVSIVDLYIETLPDQCDLDPVCCHSKDPCCGNPDQCCKDQSTNAPGTE